MRKGMSDCSKEQSPTPVQLELALRLEWTIAKDEIVAGVVKHLGGWPHGTTLALRMTLYGLGGDAPRGATNQCLVSIWLERHRYDVDVDSIICGESLRRITAALAVKLRDEICLPHGQTTLH